MGEVSAQSQMTATNNAGSVVLDIMNLAQFPEKCSGSPKMTKVLSRKGSSRAERQNIEDQESDDASKRIVVKVVCSQPDQMKPVPPSSKALLAVSAAVNVSTLTDAGEGRIKKFNRLRSVHPRNIFLFFATMSSMGTILLIYFTLAINIRA